VTRRERLRDAARAVALLVAFVAVVRLFPDLVRPSPPRDDCDRTVAFDLATMERCAALRSDDVELLLALGRRLEEAGEPARAEEMYRRALRVDPRDGEVHLRLGTLLLARGDRAGARSEALLALTVQPRSAPATELARRAGAQE